MHNLKNVSINLEGVRLAQLLLNGVIKMKTVKWGNSVKIVKLEGKNWNLLKDKI